MTDEPTNLDRAAWARDALVVFTANCYNGGHPDSMVRQDLQCAITDLICDLLHYARYRASMRSTCWNAPKGILSWNSWRKS